MKKYQEPKMEIIEIDEIITDNIGGMNSQDETDYSPFF